MTAPDVGRVVFVDEGDGTSHEVVTERFEPAFNVDNPYPPAIIKGITDEQLTNVRLHLRRWIEDLEAEQLPKLEEYAKLEEIYRAKPLGPQTHPFVGACGDTVPLVAMAVDPIHARLDTGIFKNSPVFTLKPLKKAFADQIESVNRFVEFYVQHRLELRRICSPRLLEMAKLGTMVLKTIYDRDKYSVMTYDRDWNVVTKDVTRFSGPRVVGIPIRDVLFPAAVQHTQDCQFIAERQRLTFGQLKMAQAKGQLENVDKLEGLENMTRNLAEEAEQDSANHREVNRIGRYITVFECWFDYDYNGDGINERLVATYSFERDEILQLRFNWYFHQRKPYTIIPYSVTTGSLYGIGIGEMTWAFQETLTNWQRMATDNAYLSNIRMYVLRKDSGLSEDQLKIYSGRTIYMDDPSKDFREIRLSDIYPSTLSERQNLFGLAEKRTGVSDYLTGRESPVVGSRATATSTMALIQEGTKRVEQVLENIRNGFAEVVMNCIYIWMQYGLDDIDDIVFGGDQIATDVKNFFSQISVENLDGAIAVDLTTSDASQNRAAMQQVQLSIIQVMMGYLEKVTQLGAQALQMQQQAPQIAEFYGEIANSARAMFKDLLTKYDMPNPEQYLPDLEKFLHGTANGPGAAGVDQGQPGTPPGAAGVQVASTGTGFPAAVPPQPIAPFGQSPGIIPFPGAR